MDYKKKAETLFCEGYNCAQAVFLTFAEELGMERETALKLSSSFGGGMGGLREVCGAVSGMFMTAGLVKGYTGKKVPEEKAAHYARLQRMAEEFKKENGSIICRELLGLAKGETPMPQERTKEYYKKRPCGELCGCAAAIVARELGLFQE
ncbi:MAG: C_GCAxxG_C_C family protein [Clostridia bacterium]|nr:C_GCAxxG_C_C family protein [Clostridia bacterium]